MAGLPHDDLTPEEWADVAASPAAYVATRLGPINVAAARVIMAMEAAAIACPAEGEA